MVITFSTFAFLKPEIKNRFFFTDTTKEYLDANLKRTALAYAASRGVNAIVSFLQDADFGVNLGVAAQVSPGEFLDPLNDMVERFSWLMLICFTIIGVEKVVYEIFQNVGFSLLWFCSIFLIFAIWFDFMNRFAVFFLRLAALSILLLFWIPVQAIVGDVIHEKYFKDDFQEKVYFIEKNVQEEVIEEQSILSRLKDMVNIKEKIEVVKKISETYIDKFLGLIVIFTLESVIMPLFTFFALVKVFPWIFKENRLLNSFQQYFMKKIKA